MGLPSQHPCPPVDRSMVEFLEDYFVNPISAAEGKTPMEIGVLVGQAKVAVYLRQAYEHQQKNKLDSPST